MAATYTFGDLVNMERQNIPALREEKTVDMLCMKAQTFVWNRFPFRETIATLPPFWCVPDTQDFGAPAVIVPDDFQGLWKAFIVNTSAWPEDPWNLKVLRELDPTAFRSMPDAISYNKATQSFRLSRRCTESMTAPDFFVMGEYKKLPTKITKSNYQTFVLFSEDQYIGVWGTVMAHVADPSNPTKAQFAAGAVAEMAANEGLNLGETPFAPDEALATSNYAGLGGYPVWF